MGGSLSENFQCYAESIFIKKGAENNFDALKSSQINVSFT